MKKETTASTIDSFDNIAAQHLASIVHFSADAIFSKSADGIILSWNNSAEKIFGYTSKEVLGKSINILDLPDTNLHEELLKRYDKSEMPEEHFFVKRRKKDGSVIELSQTVSPIYDSNKKIIAFSTISRDITNRVKRASYTHSLISASLDPFVTINTDGKITMANEATQKITGHSLEELIGSYFSSYFIEPHKAEEAYKEAFEKEFVKDRMLTIQNKDESYSTVLYNASVYVNEMGTVLGIFATAREITQQIKAEQELEEFKHFFTKSSDLCCISNTAGCFEILNPNFNALLGFSEEELIGKQFLEFIHPEDLDATQMEFFKLTSGASTINFTNRFRTKNNEYLWLSWYTSLNSTTGKMYTIARNVTNEKLSTENEIEKQKEFSRIADLEKFRTLTVDRELKMIELKEEIESLKAKLISSPN